MTLRLSQAAEVRLGRQRAPQYEQGDHLTPYLRSANVLDGSLDLADVKSMNFDPVEQSIFGLVPGDVLMTEGSGSAETVGTSAVWGAEIPGTVCFQNTLLRLRPRTGVTDGRFLAWWARHAHASGQINAVTTGANIQHIGSDGLKDLRIHVPAVDEQRRIADFLDDRVTRIDQIITAREAQLELIHESADRASFEVISGHRVVGARRTVEERWLGTIPAGWPLLSVGSEFQVELGKMLDEKQQTGKWPLPYLRNTNVQWDVISTDDVKIMDIAPHERSRFTVTPGDLLICEGGQPGRAAIWAGGIAPLAYQKALHRARSRGRSHPRWLLECLRVAVRFGVFEAANGQTTIGHLTNEQLRAQRFPFPDTKTQSDLLTTLSADREAVSATSSALTQSVALLREYKQVLITAAVTGELDVTTAGSGIPG